MKQILPIFSLLLLISLSTAASITIIPIVVSNTVVGYTYVVSGVNVNGTLTYGTPLSINFTALPINTIYNVSNSTSSSTTLNTPKYPHRVFLSKNFVPNSTTQFYSNFTNNVTLQIVVQQTPKVNKIFNTVIGGTAIFNSSFNFTINSPQSINGHFAFNSNYSNSLSTITISPNVFANISILGIPKINKRINLSYLQNYTYIPLNITVSAPSFLKANIHQNITPSWSSRVYYNNSNFNISVYSDEINKLNINKTLAFGAVYSNSTYNITFHSPSFNSNNINTSVLQEYYASKVSNNCGQYVNYTSNTSNGIIRNSLCVQVKGSPVSIFNICAGNQFLANQSYGLGQCVIAFAAEANQTEQRLTSENTRLTKENANLTNLNTELLNGAHQGEALTNSVSSFLTTALEIAAVLLVIYAWTTRRSKYTTRVGHEPKSYNPKKE